VSISAIIVGAGTGRRIGGDQPKQYQPIAGKPVFYYTLKKFEDCPLVDEIVIVVAREWMPYVSNEIVDRFSIEKASKIVAGGKERQDSVRAGLQAVDSPKLVVIHDAVRPFISAEKLASVIRAGQEFKAAILAISTRDTVKTEKNGFVHSTPERSQLRLVQTPQVFEYDLLQTAYAQAESEDFVSTDDSALVERTGHKVKVVEGEANNIKITLPIDLKLAEILISEYG